MPQQRFGTEQFAGTISGEIERLLVAGKTDAAIVKLFADRCRIAIDADSISRYDAESAARGRPEWEIP